MTIGNLLLFQIMISLGGGGGGTLEQYLLSMYRIIDSGALFLSQ